MQRVTLRTDYLQTIDWLGDSLVDWTSGGQQYGIDGTKREGSSHACAYGFDASLTSPDGQYVFVYHRLGTKGLLLRNGTLLREVNRSYYHADSYEYPAAFVEVNGVTYLLHCPLSYRRLDFEAVETGVLVTDVPGRDPQDFFHARLTVSPDQRNLLVNGWVWHPRDLAQVYNIADCLANPLLLDQGGLEASFGTEVNTASFIDDHTILIGASAEEPFDDERAPLLPPLHLAIWYFRSGELSTAVPVEAPFGNLFAIDSERAWDLYRYPKIIGLRTGKVLASAENIFSGTQSSAIAPADPKEFPQLKFDRRSGRIAIRLDKETIEVLTP